MELLGAMMQSKIESNTVTFNASISACEKGSAWENVLPLLSAMAQSEASFRNKFKDVKPSIGLKKRKHFYIN